MFNIDLDLDLDLRPRSRFYCGAILNYDVKVAPPGDKMFCANGHYYCRKNKTRLPATVF